MSTIQPEQQTAEDTAVVAAARAGDEAAFSTLAERYRPELQVHCYRMLGSFNDAEDMVQDTLLRGWRKRASFEGRSSFRAWLYRIATNACLDFLDRNRRQVVPAVVNAATARDVVMPPPHIPWLQPYPDRLLEQTAPRETEPDAAIVARENIELAFLVAMQFLPAKQRAVLILRDVLDWSARETAELLDVSVASVNGALQRARATLRQHQAARRPEWTPGAEPDEQQRTLLQRYVDATERNDPDAIAELLREDVRFSMPPEPATFAGRDVVVKSWVDGGFGSPTFGDFRCLLTRANRMPAVACYLRRPGDSAYRPLALDVLQIEQGVITDIVAFPLEPLVEAFGLPPTL